jgi:hypothetical protein
MLEAWVNDDRLYSMSDSLQQVPVRPMPLIHWFVITFVACDPT